MNKRKSISIILVLAILIIVQASTAHAISKKAFAAYIKTRCAQDAAYRRNRTSLCDFDKDGLTNRAEMRLRTNYRKPDTDRDGISDGDEYRKYHTNPLKADTDGDGYSDLVEIRAGTNPRDPRDHPGGTNSCTTTASPFDANGNTSSFGIPSGLIGNISSGKTFFATHCFACHGGDKGTNYTYPLLVAAVTGPKMGFSFPNADFANLVAYLNQTNIPATPIPNCALTPTPTPNPGSGGGASTPTATPTPTPIPTIAGGNCTPQPNPFNNGNTTSFNIPTGITGNITAGQTQFSQTCFGCHGADRGTNYDYPTLFAAVNGPPMYLSSLTVQQIANVVAYLNRTNIPPTPSPNCNPAVTPSPTPTATPLSDAARGALVFKAACSTCHTNPRSLRNSSATRINEAIAEVNQMRSIQLSAEQLRTLVVYLGSI